MPHPTVGLDPHLGLGPGQIDAHHHAVGQRHLVLADGFGQAMVPEDADEAVLEKALGGRLPGPAFGDQVAEQGTAGPTVAAGPAQHPRHRPERGQAPDEGVVKGTLDKSRLDRGQVEQRPCRPGDRDRPPPPDVGRNQRCAMNDNLEQAGSAAGGDRHLGPSPADAAEPEDGGGAAVRCHRIGSGCHAGRQKVLLW